MTFRQFSASLVIMVLAAGFSQGIARAQQAQPPAASGDADARPYDTQIYRLSEILGAVHYLRELCGAAEGQAWRNQMRDLVNAEGTSALRRARLVDSFNKGYRGYARTYRTCTRPAVLAIARFMEQGSSIANGLVEDHR
jgi:uncharacterized protein (TIGR02301 family)